MRASTAVQLSVGLVGTALSGIASGNPTQPPPSPSPPQPLPPRRRRRTLLNHQRASSLALPPLSPGRVLALRRELSATPLHKQRQRRQIAAPTTTTTTVTTTAPASTTALMVVATTATTVATTATVTVTVTTSTNGSQLASALSSASAVVASARQVVSSASADAMRSAESASAEVESYREEIAAIRAQAAQQVSQAEGTVVSVTQAAVAIVVAVAVSSILSILGFWLILRLKRRRSRIVGPAHAKGGSDNPGKHVKKPSIGYPRPINGRGPFDGTSSRSASDELARTANHETNAVMGGARHGNGAAINALADVNSNTVDDNMMQQQIPVTVNHLSLTNSQYGGIGRNSATIPIGYDGASAVAVAYTAPTVRTGLDDYQLHEISTLYEDTEVSETASHRAEVAAAPERRSTYRYRVDEPQAQSQQQTDQRQQQQLEYQRSPEYHHEMHMEMDAQALRRFSRAGSYRTPGRISRVGAAADRLSRIDTARASSYQPPTAIAITHYYHEASASSATVANDSTRYHGYSYGDENATLQPADSRMPTSSPPRYSPRRNMMQQAAATSTMAPTTAVGFAATTAAEFVGNATPALPPLTTSDRHDMQQQSQPQPRLQPPTPNFSRRHVGRHGAQSSVSSLPGGSGFGSGSRSGSGSGSGNEHDMQPPYTAATTTSFTVGLTTGALRHARSASTTNTGSTFGMPGFLNPATAITSLGTGTGTSYMAPATTATATATATTPGSNSHTTGSRRARDIGETSEGETNSSPASSVPFSSSDGVSPESMRIGMSHPNIRLRVVGTGRTGDGVGPADCDSDGSRILGARLNHQMRSVISVRPEILSSTPGSAPLSFGQSSSSSPASADSLFISPPATSAPQNLLSYPTQHHLPIQSNNSNHSINQNNHQERQQLRSTDAVSAPSSAGATPSQPTTNAGQLKTPAAATSNPILTRLGLTLGGLGGLASMKPAKTQSPFSRWYPGAHADAATSSGSISTELQANEAASRTVAAPTSTPASVEIAPPSAPPAKAVSEPKSTPNEATTTTEMISNIESAILPVPPPPSFARLERLSRASDDSRVMSLHGLVLLSPSMATIRSNTATNTNPTTAAATTSTEQRPRGSWYTSHYMQRARRAREMVLQMEQQAVVTEEREREERGKARFAAGNERLELNVRRLSPLQWPWEGREDGREERYEPSRAAGGSGEMTTRPAPRRTKSRALSLVGLEVMSMMMEEEEDTKRENGGIGDGAKGTIKKTAATADGEKMVAKMLMRQATAITATA